MINKPSRKEGRKGGKEGGKRKKTQINKGRGEKRNITTDTIQIQQILETSYKQL
jgi:hypothetical protein